MGTRMETAVWPKHEVGCEVDKITSWTSTTWKSVANILEKQLQEMGGVPLESYPSNLFSGMAAALNIHSS